MAHLARHRNSPYDSERKSEMAGQRRCAWSSTLHHRPVRHRRITESTCNRSCTAAGTALFELRNGTALRALADFEGAEGNIPRALEIYRELLGLLRAGGIDPNSSLKDAVDLSNIYGATSKLH